MPQNGNELTQQDWQLIERVTDEIMKQYTGHAFDWSDRDVAQSFPKCQDCNRFIRSHTIINIGLCARDNDNVLGQDVACSSFAPAAVEVDA